MLKWYRKASVWPLYRLRLHDADTNFPAEDYAEDLQAALAEYAAGACQDSVQLCKRRREKACRYRGVCLSAGKYVAQITVAGRHHYLGVFSTEAEAAKAYDR